MVKLQAMLPDWVTMATPRVAGLEPMLVGPQGGAGQAVDEAVAVGTHQRHAVGGGEEFLLEMGVAGLGKSAGIDDGAAAALVPQLTDHFDGGLALDRDEGGIDGRRRSRRRSGRV